MALMQHPQASVGLEPGARIALSLTLVLLESTKIFKILTSGGVVNACWY